MDELEKHIDMPVDLYSTCFIIHWLLKFRDTVIYIYCHNQTSSGIIQLKNNQNEISFTQYVLTVIDYKYNNNKPSITCENVITIDYDYTRS